MTAPAPRPQLEPGALPTDGLAHRLARDVLTAIAIEDHEPMFSLVIFDTDGRIEPGLLVELYFLRGAGTPKRARDPQGYAADLRALTAYTEATGERGKFDGWVYVMDRTTAVPWDYGAQ